MQLSNNFMVSKKEVLGKNRVSLMFFTLLEKEFPEDIILSSYEELLKEANDIYNIEYDALYKKQGYVAPEEDNELYNKYLSEASVWDRVGARCKKIYKPEEKEIIAIDEAKLQERTEAIKKFYNLDEQFIQIYNRYSFDNEVVGECIFYVMLSLLSKQRNDIVLGNNVNLFQHFFLVQDSGSGKDRGFDYLMALSDNINEIHKEKNYGSKNLITYMELSGTETMETLLDHYPSKSNGQVDTEAEPIKGILSSNDLLILRECSFLFKGGSSEGKQSKREILLQSMEGRSITKTLIKWNGHSTTTICNACITGATRPIENMQEHLVNTGLQQRAINYMRKINKDTRISMIDKVIDNSMLTPNHYDNIKKDMESLANKLYDFYTFFKDTQFEIVEVKQIHKMIKEKMHEFINEVDNELDNEIHKDLMYTFFGRFNGLVNVIGLYNAAIRKSSKVEPVDIERSLQFIEKSFKSIMNWVQSNIKEEAKVENRRERYAQKINNIGKVYKILPKMEFLEKLQTTFGVKKAQAYNVYSEFEGILFSEEKGVITFKEHKN